ncbi:hypothetical protein K8O68_03930 [Salipaludibacillus sp. CUR1]|nr:hypothetical protein [Salipaludibacillus sp. CUR1]MCE7791575.1 hypothetical protein [Salipaludibacillus sp. CUR1]
MDKKNRTVAGTDIDEVKRLNRNSGLTYNEVKNVLAKMKNSKPSPPEN